jgi:radical SAM superfamily enzyme YgiQ (UPF0313 family)
MFYDHAEGMVFRPPSEANSLILRVTIGCSHNACTFCAMYKDVPFRTRRLDEIDTLITRTQILYPNIRRVFLADGNALALPTQILLSILQRLQQAFPRLTRVGCYAGPKDAISKSPAELTALREAGLRIAYMGIESGDPAVLCSIQKGVVPEQIIEAGQKILQAGIKLSTTVILGLGGRERTIEHALNTATVINATGPTMVGALTLMVYPGTPLARSIDAGSFTPLTTREILEEQYRLLKAINVTNPCIYRSDHASNYLPIAGTLPKDKAHMLTSLLQVMNTTEVSHCYNFKE